MKNQVKKLIQTELEQLLVRVAVSTGFDKDAGFRGTGFFITPDGYLVTAWHCIQEVQIIKSLNILIECADGELFPGQLDEEKSIPDLDIAVIKIKRDINHNIPLLEHVPKTVKGDAVVSACYSEMYQNQKNCFSGEISLVDGLKVVTTNVIQGPGQSGSPIYHYDTGRIIGIATDVYNEDKLRNAGLAANFDFLFQRWPELNKINQNTAQLWDERLAASDKSPDVDEQPTTTVPTYDTRDNMRNKQDAFVQPGIQEIAQIFHNEREARALLAKAQVPIDKVPPFDSSTPTAFWQGVCEKPGLVSGGPEKLLSSAADIYPYNPIFGQQRRPESVPENRNTPVVVIAVTGHDDPLGLLSLAQKMASFGGIPGQISLAFVRNDAMLLELEQATTEQATKLAEVIRANNPQIQTTIATENYRDYLFQSLTVMGHNQESHEFRDVPASTRTGDIVQQAFEKNGKMQKKQDDPKSPPPTVQIRGEGTVRQLDLNASLHANRVRDGETMQVTEVIGRIFVEGPDQARFEVNNVPLSTPLSDIMKATIMTYNDNKTWPQDKDGLGIPAVIDRINPDRTDERLDPHSTIGEAQIREGETLQISPQSTLGSISPMIRDEALARIRAQIVTYKQNHPGFQVEANAKHTPTEYLFKFKAAGWGPPEILGGEPYPIDNHEVFIRLPPDFPMKAPEVFWQTPLFHPNVAAETGEVCLGVLGDRYRPGMDFKKVCQLLVDTACYQNYEVREGYNTEAQLWATSEAGQIAIEARGGKSLREWVLDRIDQETSLPPLLDIKRCH